MAWKGFKDVQATILIDLSKDEKELWNALDKDARWGVKKAKKENLKIEETRKQEDFDEFYEIYKQTCRYGGINPKSVEEIKAEKPVFFICKKDNKIIAMTAVKLKDEKTELYLNASLHEYLKYQPNNALYWCMILWAKRKGYKYFDLGGYQLDANPEDKLYHINRFKERWGGEIKTYHIHSKNPLYILGRKAIRKSSTAKKIWDKIKGRPKAEGKEEG